LGRWFGGNLSEFDRPYATLSGRLFLALRELYGVDQLFGLVPHLNGRWRLVVKLVVRNSGVHFSLRGFEYSDFGAPCIKYDLLAQEPVVFPEQKMEGRSLVLYGGRVPDFLLANAFQPPVRSKTEERIVAPRRHGRIGSSDYARGLPGGEILEGFLFAKGLNESFEVPPLNCDELLVFHCE